ncbi:MAG: hypothetical protein KGJ23_03240 [Euryarchaeota archaeon]|nr:hypothetical protein [Euryarchaeota archaeon]MDE1835613.1 hypothetical protein [Euryarchaeota archaeon]MDE1878961.1 hypothetical protein [Euryarchaeota archaeon]MDE2043765.1 hypothetical protein [Thermoplasmata archaeon]
MLALPSGLPAASFLLILIGDVLVFLLIGLTFRLLSPRKLTPIIWASPVAHLYTLFAVFLALYTALSSQPLLSLLGSFASFGVAGVIGAFLGRPVGRRIPVSLHQDGRATFVGGKVLVSLLVLLLLPLALEQAVVLFGSLAQVQSLVGALTGNPPFNFLLVGVGFLFVLGTFLSITWRFEVWEKRSRQVSARNGGTSKR